jgi:hypothetical protein
MFNIAVSGDGHTPADFGLVSGRRGMNLLCCEFQAPSKSAPQSWRSGFGAGQARGVAFPDPG